MFMPIEAFRQLSKSSDYESSRYALGGIKIERCAGGKCIAVATDGRRMATFTWQEPAEHPYLAAGETVPGFEFILPAAAVKSVTKWKLAKRLAPGAEFVHISETANPDEAVTIRAADGVSSFNVCAAPDEGRFPRWRDAFPDVNGDRWHRVTLSPKLLQGLLEASAALGTTEDSRGVTFYIRDGETAVLLQTEAAGAMGRVSSVLMPIAGHGPWQELPRPAAVEAKRKRA